MNKKIKCSGAIFTDNDKILFEDRRKICKHGEHWSFFGGSIEKNESPKQALEREIKEELNCKIKNYKFFGKYSFTVPGKDITYYMYIAKIPDLKLLKVHKNAKMKLFTIKQALRLKITGIDKKILHDAMKNPQHF